MDADEHTLLREEPEDISVAGFDDIEAGALHPRLTTSHIFLEAVGKQLAEFVLRRIEQPSLSPQKAIIPTRLVKVICPRTLRSRSYDV